MSSTQRQTNPKLMKNIRIIILLLPLLTIFQPLHQQIYQSSNFIIAIIMVILTYLGHEFHFPKPSNNTQSSKHSLLEQARKIIVCFLSSYLIALLITEVYYVVVNVYQVGYGDEIMFWFRVVVTLSNLEANLQLTQKRHRKHAID